MSISPPVPSPPNQPLTQRWAALAGLGGVGFFTLVVVALTVAQYDFMRGLGWHPWLAPTLDWPSGLALGPWGWVMTLAFGVCGILLFGFAHGLGQHLPGRAGQVAHWGLWGAGCALLALMAPTDPTFRTTPATLAGRVHDAAFVALGLSLFPALIATGFAMRAWPNGQRWALYTWLTVGLALPAFALKGAAFYVFLLAVSGWFLNVAGWLWRKAEGNKGNA